MGNLLTTDAELQAVANAIRSKGGTSANLGFPNGMVNAIGALNVGTGLNPAATAADIRNGKKAVVNRQTLTGSMTEKAAATYNTSFSDQEISANQFLTGAQTIKAVTTSNIYAANIKSGVTVKVGDANSEGRIKNVTGTYKGEDHLIKYTNTLKLYPMSNDVGYVLTAHSSANLHFETTLPSQLSGCKFLGCPYADGYLVHDGQDGWFGAGLIWTADEKLWSTFKGYFRVDNTFNMDITILATDYIELLWTYWWKD